MLKLTLGKEAPQGFVPVVKNKCVKFKKVWKQEILPQAYFFGFKSKKIIPERWLRKSTLQLDKYIFVIHNKQNYLNWSPVEVAEKQDPQPAATFPALWAVLPVAQAHVGHAPHSYGSWKVTLSN